jgi:glucose/mannose-6-phosphate isomerase
LESAAWLTGSQASLEEAAEIVEDIVGNGAGSAASEADKIAAAIEGRVAIIYGGTGITALAARRWKTQVNENAKWPAFWSELPELDHNEIVGWAGELTRDLTALVWLRDDAEGERLALRAELSRDLIESETSFAGEVWSRGSGALARLFSLMSIGDLASLALAERRGVDPVAVERIEELKQRLRGDRT